MTLLTAIIGAWLAALAVIAGPLRLEFAHSYAHWLSSGGLSALPVITQRFALPVLRGGDSAGAEFVFIGYWAVVGLAPLVLLVLLYQARDPVALLERWAYFGGAYALFVVTSGILVACGLALPFAVL